jgi:uncharacterized membrane protein
MSKKLGIGFLLILMILFVFVLWNTTSFKNPTAKMFPQAVAGVGLILVIAQLLIEIKKPAAKLKEQVNKQGRRNFYILLSAIIVYNILVPIFGFFTATILLLCGTIWLLGFKQISALLGVTAMLNIIIYITFVIFLKVRLPGGIF